MNRRTALRTLTNYLKTTPYPFTLGCSFDDPRGISVTVFSLPKSEREAFRHAYGEFLDSHRELDKYGCLLLDRNERDTVAHYPQFATPEAVAAVYRAQAAEITEAKAAANAFGADLRDANEALEIAKSRAEFHGWMASVFIVVSLIFGALHFIR